MTSSSGGLQTSYTYTRTAAQGVFPANQVQQFMIQAQNLIGLSSVSSTVSITGCNVPT